MQWTSTCVFTYINLPITYHFHYKNNFIMFGFGMKYDHYMFLIDFQVFVAWSVFIFTYLQSSERERPPTQYYVLQPSFKLACYSSSAVWITVCKSQPNKHSNQAVRVKFSSHNLTRNFCPNRPPSGNSTYTPNNRSQYEMRALNCESFSC